MHVYEPMHVPVHMIQSDGNPGCWSPPLNLIERGPLSVHHSEWQGGRPTRLWDFCVSTFKICYMDTEIISTYYHAWFQMGWIWFCTITSQIFHPWSQLSSLVHCIYLTFQKLALVRLSFPVCCISMVSK